MNSDSSSDDDQVYEEHTYDTANSERIQAGTNDRLQDLAKIQQRARMQLADLRKGQATNKATSGSLDQRELNYRNMYLSNQLDKMKEKYRRYQTKTRASLAGLKDALTAVEQAVEEKTHAICGDSNKILSLVHSLQRHMANGYHAIPTETARRLLSDIAKMAVGLDDKMKGHTTLKYSKVAAVAAAAGASESMRWVVYDLSYY
jgi:hypothetical protein